MSIVTIAGITYDRGDTAYPASEEFIMGEECASAAQALAAAGKASLAPSHSENAITRMRLEVIKRLARWIPLAGSGTPNADLHNFLFNGIHCNHDQANLDYDHFSSRSSNYHIRLMASYLLAAAENDVGARVRSLLTYFDTSTRQCDETFTAEAAIFVPFTCAECDRSITDMTVIRRSAALDATGSIRHNRTPTHCWPCLNDRVYSRLQGIYLVSDADVVTIFRSESRHMEYGVCSLGYAEESFYCDETGQWWSTRPSRGSTFELQNYSADPFAHFQWDARNKLNALVFGVELEMESTQGNAMAIVEALGGNAQDNYILKSDGSLTDGVELVTMPFTLAQHLDGSGVPWKKILDTVGPIARSGNQTDHCGIHIHINKKALSALTIGKMLVFLNDPALASLITVIAQRSNNTYCQRSAKKLTDGTASSANRYDIMNISVRHPTCEIRMFKGNLTLERLYKNLEFCHALIQYCRQSSMRALADWGNFSRWLIAQRGQYPNLVRFLVDKQVLGFRQLMRDTRDGQIILTDK